MSRTRREFLRFGAGSALVLGLGGLRDPSSPVGDVKLDALKAMKARRSFGVFLAIPKLDRDRRALGAHLESLLVSGAPHGLCQRLMEVVYACVPSSELELGLHENATLVDHQGRHIVGARLDFSTAGTAEKTLTDVLHGNGRSSFRCALQATDDAKRYFEGLKDPSRPEYANAAQWWLANFDNHAAFFVSGLERERNERARDVLRIQLMSAYRTKLAGNPDLPFGVLWKRTRDAEVASDPCPSCGLAVMPEQVRRFVRFLEK